MAVERETVRRMFRGSLAGKIILINGNIRVMIMRNYRMSNDHCPCEIQRNNGNISDKTSQQP
jgi:hypothetical protein